FVLNDPAAACHLALALVGTSPHPVRVGMAHGAVVALHGDYYGPTVNLAARLVAVAPPSTVVVSEAMTGSQPNPDLTFEAIPVGPLCCFPDVTPAYGVSRPAHVYSRGAGH